VSAPVCVITGASRGIGAATAILLAERGWDIAFNYLSKQTRADTVARQIETLGRRVLSAQADLTEDRHLYDFASRVQAEFGSVQGLILNAAGGLEKGRDVGYAYALNVTSSHRLVDELLPIMAAGSVIVFVTSHMSHFYGRLPVVIGYERVASTKKEAEETLRARIAPLADAGIRLVVVSGDLIEGTINARLMQREYADLIVRREAEVGPLPSVAEFSKAIADAVGDRDLVSGTTIFVGSTDWKTYAAVSEEETRRQPATIRTGSVWKTIPIKAP